MNDLQNFIIKKGSEKASLESIKEAIQSDLTLFNANIAEGKPQKLEYNDIQWIAPSEISNYDFCSADEEILARICEVYK